MKAVIMAGGKGTRLRPLTCNTPKPMVPLLNRPVMEYTIELLRKHGIRDIAVTLQYKPEVIRDYFGDGRAFGVNLRYFEESSPLGTAGSVKHAAEFLDDSFIVISGDALTDFNLTEAMETHRRNRALATIVMTHVEDPLEFGVVMTKEDGRIIRFLEKPSWGEVFSDTVNTGIYLFEPELLDRIADGREVDFSKDVFPALLQSDERLYGHVAEGYWSDIGNLEQYRQTQFDMLDGLCDVQITGIPLGDGIWVGHQAEIAETAVVEGPAYIGDYCVVREKARLGAYTILGEGNLICEGAELQRTVLWAHGVVESDCELSGATVCGRHRLARASVVNEGTVIGANCAIGAHANIGARLKIFPHKIIDDYAEVTHSVIWQERVHRRLFGALGVQGRVNRDITTSMTHRLAMALASVIPQGALVAVTHDGAPFSDIVASSMADGIRISGLSTVELEETEPSLVRCGIFHSDCRAGIHIRCGEGQERIILEFMDEKGLPLSKGMERKIENAYFQENFRNVAPREIGARKPFASFRSVYVDQLIRTIRSGPVRERAFTVILEYEDRQDAELVLEILNRLHCKVICTGSRHLGDRDPGEWMRRSNADIGIRWRSGGRLPSFIDESGRCVGDEQLYSLQTLLSLRFSAPRLTRFVLPVDAPYFVDRLARQKAVEVIPGKTDPRSMMEASHTEGFSLYFDGIFTMARILECMALDQVSLSSLVESMPIFALSRHDVECHWTDKGRVMRHLMEQTKNEPVELVDGIKLLHDDGWTLIVPDGDQPAFQVTANADNVEQAEERAVTYMKKIIEIRSTGSRYP